MNLTVQRDSGWCHKSYSKVSRIVHLTVYLQCKNGIFSVIRAFWDFFVDKNTMKNDQNRILQPDRIPSLSEEFCYDDAYVQGT